jgi:hypothetical protein
MAFLGAQGEVEASDFREDMREPLMAIFSGGKRINAI